MRSCSTPDCVQRRTLRQWRVPLDVGGTRYRLCFIPCAGLRFDYCALQTFPLHVVDHYRELVLHLSTMQNQLHAIYESEGTGTTCANQNSSAHTTRLTALMFGQFMLFQDHLVRKGLSTEYADFWDSGSLLSNNCRCLFKLIILFLVRQA